MSSSTQYNCVQCNFIGLWAVSSGASAQTVQRPTVAIPSVFWRHWIHSIPKLYTAAGTEIVVGLGVGLYIESDKGARISFWNVGVYETTDAAVSMRRSNRIWSGVTK